MPPYAEPKAKIDGNGQIKTLVMVRDLTMRLSEVTTPEQVYELFTRIEDHYKVIGKYGYKLVDAIADVLAGKDGK